MWRAAKFIVSPNKRYRGSFMPMTPATMGPVCNPILYLTVAVCSSRIWIAARTRRASMGVCPSRSASSLSEGRTPTQATYSSRTVSIFATPLAAKIWSIMANCSFRNLSSWPGFILMVILSNSSIIMNRMDTRSTCSAMGTSGLFSIGPMTCAGIMYSRWRKIRLLVVFCWRSCRNLRRSPRSLWNLRAMAIVLAAPSSSARTAMSKELYGWPPKVCRQATVQPMCTPTSQHQRKYSIS
mmetsp:Transcript_71013/g.224307  ORF Transcript_71013/g.224307 Transcript_71013/m.224307 type:complete len:239 (-) Transcript_71013:379-1095(-)